MFGEKRQHTRRNSPFTSLSYRQLMQGDLILYIRISFFTPTFDVSGLLDNEQALH